MPVAFLCHVYRPYHNRYLERIMSGWNSRINAEKYDAFTKRYDIYERSSRELVRLARLAPNSVVVDLACGTGVTTMTVLERLQDTGYIHAVDSSSAMIEFARKNIGAENVAFHNISSDAVHSSILQPVDRVLCNAAFWQLDITRTLESVGRILKPHGSMVFNMPASFEAEAGPMAGNLRQKMRKVANKEFKIDLAEVSPRRPAYTHGNIISSVENAGFYLENYTHKSFCYGLDQAESFFSIPIFTENKLPGVDYETRLEIVSKACRQVEPKTLFSTAWNFYRIKKGHPTDDRRITD